MSRVHTANGVVIGFVALALLIWSFEPLGINDLVNSLIPNGAVFLRDTLLTMICLGGIVTLFVGGED